MNIIEVRRDGAVARLLLNQPARRNALNRHMWRVIAAEAGRLAGDESVRAITIESAVAGMFSAGADISEFEKNYSDPSITNEVNAEISNAIESVASCPQPTLALIDGPCVGGSVALALACDIRLSSELATYSVTPSKLGLSYHPNDLRRLVNAVGLSGASELLYSGMRWSASRALQSGLVNTVTASIGFSDHCQDLLTSICANSSTANRTIKQSMRYVVSENAENLLQAEHDFANLFSGADFREGREAFLQKRPARFPSHQP